MRTCCPHCETLYELLEDELEVTNGLATCFSCKRAFNAWKNEIEDKEPGLAPVILSSDDNQKPPETRVTTEPTPAPEKQEKPEKPDIPAEIQSNIETAPSNLGSLNFAIPELTVPAGLKPIQPTVADTESLLSPKAKKPRTPYLWLKIVAAFLLLLLVTGQLAWQNQARLLANPQARKILTLACAKLNCQLPAQHAPDQYVVLKRSLSPDPDNPKTLKLQVTIRNNAVFSQRLPDLQLTLTDFNNTVIVRQLFLPNQYHSDADQLAAQAITEISLLIQDPGWQAAGFQIEFY